MRGGTVQWPWSLLFGGDTESRQRLFWMITATILLFYGADVLDLGRPTLEPLVVRLLWTAVFVLGLRQWAVRGRSAEATWIGVFSVTSAVSMASLMMLTGGVDSYLFPWTFVLPVVAGAINPDRRRAVVGTAAIMTVAGILLLEVSAKPRAEVALLLAQMGLITGLAILAQRQFAGLVARELAAAGEREAVLAALVESESRRARSERLATLGQLAAGVAHEINNPLAYLKANLGYVREVSAERLPLEDRADIAEVLTESQAGLDRVAEIVGALRVYARDDEETLQGDVAGAIDEALRVASVRLRGVAALETGIAPHLPAVPISQGRLAQVLLNLLVNAADAVSERAGAGHVSLRVARVADGARVRFTVEDDGPGIPADVRTRLFRPFFTTKPPGSGTGLGLALVDEMVTRAGGTIEARNRPDGPGACFVVELPALPQARSTGSSSAA